MANDDNRRRRSAAQFKSPLIKCKRCGVVFDRTGARQWFCRPCAPDGERGRAAERARERRAESPAKMVAYQRQWNLKNVEHVRVYVAQKRRAAGIAAIGSIRTCPNCRGDFVFAAARQKYCAPCGEAVKSVAVLARSAKWNRENNARRNGRLRHNYETRIEVRLRVRMTTGITRSLRSGKNRKSWRDLVPYGVDELKAHLEKQFLPGMSWANMGKWHIDHIVPLCSFRLYSDSDLDFGAAWSLTNLRPLWGSDNVRKSGRRLHLI